MKKSTRQISQKNLLLEYYKKNPNKNIPHSQMRDWVIPEYKKRTDRRFEDPDRGVRNLAQEGILKKVKKGVYKYDPKNVSKRKLEDFTQKQKKEILKRDNYTCAMCGRNPKINKGLELHVDHLQPKDDDGKAIMENGQILCSRCNFIKKNLKQTTTGKKMFINLYNLAKASGEKELEEFCAELLKVFEKYKINGHIEWKK